MLGPQLWEVAPYIHGGAGAAFGGDQPEDEPWMGTRIWSRAWIS